MTILSPKEIIKKLKAKGVEVMCYSIPYQMTRLIIMAPEIGSQEFNSKEKDTIVSFLRKNKVEREDALIVQLNLNYTDRPFYF